jgi:hypothetical protein
MYGGITLIGVLTRGVAGLAPSGLALDETQWALWRAGHAHAGVWVILSLVMQVLIDSTRLSTPLMWLARISAPAAAVAISGGFFGLRSSRLAVVAVLRRFELACCLAPNRCRVTEKPASDWHWRLTPFERTLRMGVANCR